MQARPYEPLAASDSALNDDRDRGVPGQRLGVTVVVPTFNSADHVGACLASVERCLPGAEVIVVDNGSDDGTVAATRQALPAATVICGHGNVGFGGACNLAAEHATQTHLLYLNPDATLVEVDLQALTDLCIRRSFGLLAAMVVDGGGRVRPTLRRQCGRWAVEYFAAHVLSVLSRLAPRPRYVERPATRGTYTVSGAMFMVAAEEFRSLGGFDTRFFMYYEDTDLTRRYREAGYPLQATAALHARHFGGASAPTAQRNALSFLGWLEYVHKWHGARAARAAALLARVTYSLLVASLRLLAKASGSVRVADKAKQMEAMVAHIAGDGFDPATAAPRYPTAAPLARRAFRSAARRAAVQS